MRRVRLIPRTAHNQVLLIGLLFVALGSVVLVLGITQLNGVRRDLDRAHRELAPAADHLARADREYAAAHAAFLEMLTATDAAERTAFLALTTKGQAAGDEAWRAFLPHADALPNTKQLVEAVAYDRALLDEEGAAMIGNPTPEVEASFERTFGRLNTEIDTLLRRFSAANRAAVVEAEDGADTTFSSVLIVYAVVLGVIVATTAAAVLLTRRRERREAVREAERRARSERDELDTRLQRALEVSPTEDTTFAVVQAAMRRSVPDEPVDLLVAASQHGHLRRVASTVSDDGECVCGVTSPRECPATSRGATTVFRGSDALDTCPVRAAQGRDATATTCIPVSVSGHATGVICALGTPGAPADEADLATLELLARKTGERLTLTRAFARSESLARTDPLTGLFNRRMVEEKAAELDDEGRQYVVAYADLDHFKLVNDVYGHDAGDHALRLFARVLRDSIRPSDIPSRYGGEEFVVLLPDCTVDEGLAVLERIRSKLPDAFDHDDEAPRFTMSVGLSQPDGRRPFDEVVAEADAALRAAKDSGRDRVVVAATGAATSTDGTRLGR